MEKEKGSYKFDEPTPTKSGERVIDLWNQLNKYWGYYKKAKVCEELPRQIRFAKKIQKIQDDLGLRVEDFFELRNDPQAIKYDRAN
jgi:hypothetical protein